MTHEQAKIISDIGKWEIQVGDWVYESLGDDNKFIKGVVTDVNNDLITYWMIGSNGIKTHKDNLTLIPQEKHLMRLLWDNGWYCGTNPTDKHIELHFWDKYKRDYDIKKEKYFPIKDNNIHEALTNAVMYCIENGYIKKRGSSYEL